VGLAKWLTTLDLNCQVSLSSMKLIDDICMSKAVHIIIVS